MICISVLAILNLYLFCVLFCLGMINLLCYRFCRYKKVCHFKGVCVFRSHNSSTWPSTFLTFFTYRNNMKPEGRWGGAMVYFQSQNKLFRFGEQSRATLLNMFSAHLRDSTQFFLKIFIHRTSKVYFLRKK